MAPLTPRSLGSYPTDGRKHPRHDKGFTHLLINIRGDDCTCQLIL